MDDLSPVPSNATDHYHTWVQEEDSIAFLLQTTHGVVPIYSTKLPVYLYSVLVPEELLQGDDYIEDMLNWNFSASRGWGMASGMRMGNHTQLFPPLDHTYSRTIDRAEPIIFSHFFYGFKAEDRFYVELNQRLAHVLDIHWSGRHNAYCKLDEQGDMKKVVEVIRNPTGLLTTVDFEELELYLFLPDTTLIRVFDVTRYRGFNWPTETNSREYLHLKEGNTELHARRGR